MAHQTMSFCNLWQELLGFGGDVPDEKTALSLQALWVALVTKKMFLVWLSRTMACQANVHRSLESSSSNDHWHIFSFTATEVPVGRGIQIYRELDFKVGVEAHLALVDPGDQEAMMKHVKARNRPGWSRGKATDKLTSREAMLNVEKHFDVQISFLT
ncbi:hypothetical protein BDR06DRAFT_966771 [Suillus hirtellus]|nr:hypothetical protein BDR06DRAFT_966771 [Suillus hirtellus]